VSIRLLQCLCPKRHGICAVFYDDEVVDGESALRGFQDIIRLALEQGLMRQRCEVCKADVDFHYEDAKTGFKTMADAIEAGKQNEAEQAATRRFLDSTRN
jgi:hypothetical protein